MHLLLSLFCLWLAYYDLTTTELRNYSNHNYHLPFLAGVLSDKFLVKLANSTSFIKRMESDWVHDSLRVTIELLNFHSDNGHELVNQILKWHLRSGLVTPFLWMGNSHRDSLTEATDWWRRSLGRYKRSTTLAVSYFPMGKFFVTDHVCSQHKGVRNN